MSECEELVFVRFASQPSRLKLLRCVAREAACLAGLNEEATQALILAVNEACMNIMQHAYAMDPRGKIELRAIRERGALVLQLRDYANHVDTGNVRSRDLSDIRPGGLGVHLIDSLMDECGFLEPPSDGGNLYQMKKYIE